MTLIVVYVQRLHYSSLVIRCLSVTTDESCPTLKGALCRARPNDYTYEHNALIMLVDLVLYKQSSPLVLQAYKQLSPLVCWPTYVRPVPVCLFLTVALNYTEPNWRSRCSNFNNYTVCKAGPVTHAGVACYTVLYNFERWITQLVCRWRVQPTVWINANCRTLWASTSWTHIAVIGNPVTTSVWVSAFHLSSH